MIPNIKAPELYPDIDFNNEKLIDVTNNEHFIVDLQYPKMNLETSIDKCLVREEVYQKLIKASTLLPDGLKLKIWDTWRPLALQNELYELYSKQIIKDLHLENLSKEEQETVIIQCVSKPQKSIILPPVHATGGAVDLTIIDDNGNDLNMGTEFDSFSNKTQTAYFESNCSSKEDEKIRANRRLLYEIMTSVGFTNFPSEWWHFDYGDRFWAYYNKKPAIYQGVLE